MSHVAVLIANPAEPALTEDLLSMAASELTEPGAPQWLAASVAADLPFAAGPEAPGTIAGRLRTRLAGVPVDIAVLPAAGRRKRLFLADMDSTMIGQECIDELADALQLKAAVAGITERAMRGEIAFEPALRERVALLKGLDRSVIAEILASRITPTEGARTLVATMRANGAYTVLVSGGFTAFTHEIAHRLGFEENRANTLLFEGERLTGLVAEPVLGRQAKLDALIEHRTRLGLDRADVMAVGDGANDLAMLGEAGLGIAFRAKPAVAEATDVRIDHADLTALLYLQGYRREDFVD